MSDSQKEYKKLVNLAKEQLEIANEARSRIAILAIKACTIRHGGITKDEYYTLKDFATDIGVNYRTLSRWVVIQRDIAKSKKEINSNDWKAYGKQYSERKTEKEVINYFGDRRKSKNFMKDEGRNKILERDSFINMQETFQWCKMIHKIDDDRTCFYVSKSNYKKLSQILIVLNEVSDFLNNELTSFKKEEVA